MSSEYHPVTRLDPALRAAAIESLLLEKGLFSDDAVDRIAHVYEHEVGPLNGARVVARAWVDPEYRERLLTDGAAGVRELGLRGLEGDHLKVVANTPDLHNVIVCTLCSCYPWAILGLPPRWYKSHEYRARVIREPRVVLAEMGLELDDSVNVHVWDSSAEMRYLVLPERPGGTEGWSEERLASIVTRESMIGVALVKL